MAKKLKWMQTEAGRRAQAKRMKAAWAARRAKSAVNPEPVLVTDGAADRHYSVYLTMFRADKLLDVLKAIKANRLEIHILD